LHTLSGVLRYSGGFSSAGVMAAGGGYAVGVSLEDCENVTVETARLAGVAVRRGIRVGEGIRAHRTGSLVSVGTSRQHEGPSTMCELQRPPLRLR